MPGPPMAASRWSTAPTSAQLGSLRVSHDVEDGQDYTIVEGNTQGGSQPEFKLTIKGHHALTDGDFNL